jgi:hypothetical protein
VIDQYTQLALAIGAIAVAVDRALVIIASLRKNKSSK